MAKPYEIRADHDAESVVVYQAYPSSIALPALEAQRFVSPFSFSRMTWIKPSFLWLMHRSQWGQKPGQEHVLAVRIKRNCWDMALSLGVLTSPEAGIHPSTEDWAQAFEAAQVHVQWDTERSLRGAGLDHYSIQVGLSRHLIRDYAQSWILRIDDMTPLVRKLHAQLRQGKAERLKRLLPPEQVYPVNAVVAHRLGMNR